MQIEKLEILGFDVTDLEEAMQKFSQVLGIEFHDFGAGQELNTRKALSEHSDAAYENARARAAIDRRGFIELVESDPPVGKSAVRNIHFKVPDLDAAVTEMEQKGYRLVKRIEIGGLDEAVFHPDDFYGIRLCFVEYEQPTLVDAMLADGSAGGS